MNTNSTIIALATSQGIAAIAVIRLSGKDAINFANQLFPAKDLNKQSSHTIHYGNLYEGQKLLDEVLISIFKAPHSYTKENIIEISCHGSNFIVKEIIQAFIKLGASLAKPGEFTQRAFLNGRFDLTQAEAVSDLIASDSALAHQTALKQMKGGFANDIAALREKLIWFASLIELELDFGEEDVTFADRQDLTKLIDELNHKIDELISSFSQGNVIKNGIPTVIAGKPNAGKSTLLNVLLKEERAIVSEIPGTTRDFIEANFSIEGIIFRFTDTAGLRESSDVVEQIGIKRTEEKIKEASVLLYLFDVNETEAEELKKIEIEMLQLNIPVLFIGNKVDLANEQTLQKWASLLPDPIFISAVTQSGLDSLTSRLLEIVKATDFKTGNTIVTNVRHYECLLKTRQALSQAEINLHKGISGDIIAMDIRHALYFLGEITGAITTDDLLATIFSKFCIGK
jgi:tRNA modification GTPase